MPQKTVGFLDSDSEWSNGLESFIPIKLDSRGDIADVIRPFNDINAGIAETEIAESTWEQMFS